MNKVQIISKILYKHTVRKLVNPDQTLSDFDFIIALDMITEELDRRDIF